jgi:succinate dehydrogenase / fumarate reductase flavoprotein subunit
VEGTHPSVREAESNVASITRCLLDAKGTRSVDSFHRDLGKLMWEYCGMSRTAEGLRHALAEIPGMRESFWRDVRVLGAGEELNQSLEKAGRVADFFELAELICLDALERNESCGGHFREEYQTAEGEAARDDQHYSYTAAWGFRGTGNTPELVKEPLTFEYVHPSQRSYK